MVNLIKTLKIFLFINFLLMGLTSLAQSDADYIGPTQNLFKVNRIDIRGLRKIEPEAILEKITSAPGLTIDNYILRRDIKRIYQMKYFESVEAHHEVKSGANILIFSIVEKPIIKRITIEGNEEVDSSDIREQIGSKEFSIIDTNTVKADVDKIQKFYEEKGYFLAKVDFQIIKRDKETVEVKFKIKEHDMVKVKKITFLGNSALSDQELKEFMLTREESLFSFMTGTGNFKEFNFQADLERLAYLYRTRGYLQVNIGNPAVTVSEDKRWIFVTIQVNEGPQFTVNEVDFSGDLLFSDSELREKLTLESEQIYSEEKLRQDVQTMTEMYQDLGYAFVNVLRTLEPVPGENRVNIHYSFEKGKIAYFGRISIKGNSKTRDKVVRRELRVHEGMKFSGSKLRISKENVNRLGFFDRGSVIFNTVTRKGRDDVLDLEITVKERQTGQISLGAGYSTATKGFFQASVRQNNFRGLGQNLNFSLNVGQNNQTYQLGFTEPYFLDSMWSLGGYIFKDRNSNLASFEFEKQGFDIRVGYPIFEYTRLFFTYSYEETQLGEVLIPPQAFNKKLEEGTASSVELALTKDKRNNTFEPTDGHYATAGLEYMGVGGDQRWVKTNIEGRYYKPVWGDLILRSRLRVSQIFKTTERGVPRTAKFAMGGAKNMRGFNFEDVSPKTEPIYYDSNRDGTIDTSGNTDLRKEFALGGLQSILGTVEFEHPLVAEAGIKWVVFYDVGNVFNRYLGSDDDREWDFRQDYGFGFRWFSPIGVLRFEMGYPISPREGEDGNQFHFDIGQLF